MENYVSIDWLTLTDKWPVGGQIAQVESTAEALNIAAHYMANLEIHEGGLMPMLGQGFYPWIFKFSEPGLIISVPRRMDEQGVKLEFSGSWSDHNLPHRRILALAKQYNYHVTRIDVAVDLFETGLKPKWIFTLLDRYHRGKTSQPKWFPGKKGSTVYLGSRESDRMLRIYDKGQEQGVDIDWLRVEGEYKGKLAEQVAAACLENIGRVVEDMRNKLNLPLFALDILLEMAANGEHAKIKGYVKTRSDRERWLFEQVLPALRTLAISDYEAACRFVEAAQELLDAGAF